MPHRKKSPYWGQPQNAPSHPYMEYEGTQVWKAVKKAITDLDKNRDLELTEWHQYIVGYICKSLAKQNIIKAEAKKK